MRECGNGAGKPVTYLLSRLVWVVELPTRLSGAGLCLRPFFSREAGGAIGPFNGFSQPFSPVNGGAMSNLTRAHFELFRRSPDECFSSLRDLGEHCRRQKDESFDRWHLPQAIRPKP